MKKIYLSICMLISQFSWANPDTTLLPGEKTSPKYCKPRIVGMSPNKVFSLGLDFESGQTLKSSELGSFDKNERPNSPDFAKYKFVDGLRFSAKVPLINKPKLIWQIGVNYWKTKYQSSEYAISSTHQFGKQLGSIRLITAGLNTSIYKPLNEKSFISFQTSADLNGDFTLKFFQSLKYLKYTIAGMYGQRVNDRKQWAIGIAKGYNAGLVNLLPVVMFNYTSENKKWGTEITLPARAWYRRAINKNSLLRAGYEMEGASYRLNFLSTATNNYELRRGQLRTKIEYQCKLYKSFWLSAQTGYCTILNFNVDDTGADGKDFSRQFDSKRKYAVINDLSDFLFFNLSINFVSL